MMTTTSTKATTSMTKMTMSSTPTVISDGLLSSGRQMLLECAPELGSQALYILRSGDVDGRLCGGACCGWAIAGAATLAFKKRLGDRWRGCGKVVILDEAIVRQESTASSFECF